MVYFTYSQSKYNSQQIHWDASYLDAFRGTHAALLKLYVVFSMMGAFSHNVISPASSLKQVHWHP